MVSLENFQPLLVADALEHIAHGLHIAATTVSRLLSMRSTATQVCSLIFARKASLVKVSTKETRLFFRKASSQYRSASSKSSAC